MKKIIKIFEKHPLRCILITFAVLSIVPPCIVHCIYKIPSPNWFFEAAVPAGNVLTYLGTVMTFCATFSLSVLVYISNRDRENREYLLKNRTFINIDKNQEIKIEIIDLARNEYADIFINVNIGLLSEAAISNIRMKYISIDENRIGKIKKGFSKDFSDKPEIVTFPCMNKNLIEASFPIENVDKNIAKFLKESDDFMIAFDVDFVCENVKTPYTIKLALKAKGKENETDIAYIYDLEEVYFHYQSPRY